MAGAGFNQSSAESQQFSGLRGTQYQGAAEGRANAASNISQNWTKGVMQNPMLFMGQNAEQLNPSGRFGLGFNADRGVEEMGKQMYGMASAQNAIRGRLTPEGANAAAGSAMTQALPQLIPQLMAYQQWQFQQPMGLNQYAANVANQNAQTQFQGLGSQYKGESNSFGFDAQVSKPA